jgi:hypothetical protein
MLVGRNVRQVHRAWQNSHAILAQPLPQADDVAPDYKTQASALLTATTHSGSTRSGIIR